MQADALSGQIKALQAEIAAARKAKRADRLNELLEQRTALQQQLSAVPVHSINQYLSGLGIALSTTFNRDQRGWLITLTAMLPIEG